MSHQATGWVLEFSDSRLGARLVLLEISYRMNNESGICYPSLETIAHECRMTKSGVIQAIDNLENSGELSVDRVEKPGSGSVNRYSMPLFLEWWEAAKELGIKGKKGQPKQEERVNPITKRVNQTEEKGQPGIPELLEPSEEPSVITDRDLSELWKEMRRAYKRLTGKSLGSGLRGGPGDRFREAVSNFGQEKVLAGFRAFLDHQGKENLRKFSYSPIFIFMKQIGEWVDDASIQVEEPEPEKVAGPRGVGERYAHLVKH